jgi:uncharacterized membrane protein
MAGPRADAAKETSNRFASALTRLFVAMAAGLAAFGLVMLVTPWQVAVLVGWDVTAVVFLAWVWLTVAGMDSHATAELASAEDDSRFAADIILIAATIVSLVGVALAILKAAGQSGWAKGLTTAVATVSLLLSWTAIHTVYTLRYANLYYRHGGGIHFNSERAPDFGDFAYVAFTIGMTYQVSDTSLTSKAIRMAALRHAFLSFLFGTGVIAMTINLVASLFRA